MITKKKDCQLECESDPNLFICAEVLKRTGYYHGVEKKLCEKCCDKLIKEFCEFAVNYHESSAREKTRRVVSIKPDKNQKKPTEITIIRYTDGYVSKIIEKKCLQYLKSIKIEKNIINVPKPINKKRCFLTLYEQILEGTNRTKAKYIFLAEQDVLYHPSRFYFIPSFDDVLYYQNNLFYCTEKGYLVPRPPLLSMLVTSRELLIDHLVNRIKAIKGGLIPKLGSLGYNDMKLKESEIRYYWAEYPSVDIRHNLNFTGNRESKDKDFYIDCVPFWGHYKKLRKKLRLK